mmetsp:Transcript_9433/g.10754  ORF Transcript_9433/g.10754 Transcript_9433/m.10754 type:complete len:367 (+) Transcript_9433:11-1111(+)
MFGNCLSDLFYLKTIYVYKEKMCETDFDCPGPQVCYFDVSWDERKNFCDCSSFYGWENIASNCTEYNAGARFIIATSVIVCVVSGSFFVVALSDLWIFVKYPKSRRLSKNVVTFIYCVLGLLSQLCIGFSLIGSVTSPEENTVLDDFGDEKLAKFGIAERLFSMLELSFLFLASLNISLVWLDLSNKIKNLNTETSFSRTYQRIVYASQFGFVLLSVIGVVVGIFFISALVLLPYIFFILYVYKRGHSEFTKVLDHIDSISNDNPYRKLARLVRITTATVACSMIGYFICASTFVALLAIDWQEYSPRGKVSRVVIFLQLAHLIAAGWMGSLFWYTHFNINTIKLAMSQMSVSVPGPSFHVYSSQD